MFSAGRESSRAMRKSWKIWHATLVRLRRIDPENWSLSTGLFGGRWIPLPAPNAGERWKYYPDSQPPLWRAPFLGPWVSYWGICPGLSQDCSLMISSKLAMGSIRAWCARIRPKWRKFPMISISWRPCLTPTYMPEEPLNCNPAWCQICCRYFFLDSQGGFLYSPFPEKQVLSTINYQLNST